jgi:peptidoglycan/LPS O-acetylase OafA/YrhL
MLLLFFVPFIPGGEKLCYNGVYEFCCVAFVFPLVVWLGASGRATDNRTCLMNQFLGEISYPLYIVHYPVMYLFYAWMIKYEHYTLESVLWIAIGVVCFCVVLAWGCLKYYDLPVRNWLQKMMQNRK